jgi:hypothetical protein
LRNELKCSAGSFDEQVVDRDFEAWKNAKYFAKLAWMPQMCPIINKPFRWFDVQVQGVDRLINFMYDSTYDFIPSGQLHPYEIA